MDPTTVAFVLSVVKPRLRFRSFTMKITPYVCVCTYEEEKESVARSPLGSVGVKRGRWFRARQAHLPHPAQGRTDGHTRTRRRLACRNWRSLQSPGDEVVVC